MMTSYNYLPVIKRARLFLNGYTRQAPVRSRLSLGGEKAYLTDLAIYGLNRYKISDTDAVNTAGVNALCRIGKYGSRPLTEDFYPMCLLDTGCRQESGVWEFAKPYRLFPGERLSALVDYRYDRDVGVTNDWGVPAVQFNAVRVSDNRPILLCDNADVLTPAASQTFRFASEKLQCPADTPIDIYSCVFQPTSTIVYDGVDDYQTVTRLMVYGPDGRQWWDSASWPFLFDPPGFRLDLRTPEWVLNKNEDLYIEFITATTDTDICVVLRGQVETVI